MRSATTLLPFLGLLFAVSTTWRMLPLLAELLLLVFHLRANGVPSLCGIRKGYLCVSSSDGRVILTRTQFCVESESCFNVTSGLDQPHKLSHLFPVLGTQFLHICHPRWHVTATLSAWVDCERTEN